MFILVLMVIFKGMVVVLGILFVVLLVIFGIIGVLVEGLVFIVGVDRIMDMVCMVVNLVGNILVVIVMFKFEGKFDFKKGIEIMRVG